MFLSILDREGRERYGVLSILYREGRGRYGVPLNIGQGGYRKIRCPTQYWTGRVEEDTVSLSILDREGRGRYGVPLHYGQGG